MGKSPKPKKPGVRAARKARVQAIEEARTGAVEDARKKLASLIAGAGEIGMTVLLDLAQNCRKPAVRRAAARDLIDVAGLVVARSKVVPPSVGPDPFAHMTDDELLAACAYKDEPT